ncbi:clusterin-associated protein 1 [Athalia rosae]|uniref:clusterin-associated protein 1 n=1 Tax=Athalia rosae TaxID=37344 RepID=UPI0020340CFE|nr:clusterin-associated protein 1 [Athalia rosae]XP_020708389.2 clusterin-associated protein 1 [Athalia rosae]XP_048515888.1 clusterin-associated protein 1 [Athalia rosae]XP_048515889.1 clusterin-associated protein 1 [Athalia rosae]
MSFKDLRNFTEMMRVLGYPRLISLANFRVPNFPLVAEILIWLVKRFDPDADIPSEHSSEQERVALVRRTAEFMAIKANIKLNTKKIYQADGYAVKELLKITTLLYEAQTRSTEKAILLGDNLQSGTNFDISGRINELKTTRQLASQLTINGATLFDLLGREVDLREIRNNKMSRQFDSSEIELAMKEVIESIKLEISDTKKQIENIKDTEQSLDAKIERRRTELDRNQKRLQTLRKVRPAFMEEFEKLEVELKGLYDIYLQKFRYLAYLEHLHEDAAKAEQERFERRQAATKKQLEQLRGEDVTLEGLLEGSDSIFNSNQETIGHGLGDNEKQLQERIGQGVRIKTGMGGSSRAQTLQRRVYGSMSGRQRAGMGTALDLNDSVGSLDSDSDLFIDGDLDDDDELINSDGELELTGLHAKNNQEKRAVSKIDHSDEDF